MHIVCAVYVYKEQKNNMWINTHVVPYNIYVNEKKYPYNIEK